MEGQNYNQVEEQALNLEATGPNYNQVEEQVLNMEATSGKTPNDGGLWWAALNFFGAQPRRKIEILKIKLKKKKTVTAIPGSFPCLTWRPYIGD